MKPWKHHSSRVLFEHPRLTISEEKIELPSGEHTEWITLHEGADSVCIICLDNDHRVLVARQYCAAPRAVVREFPGGKIDLGESVEAAARRELLEEAGIICTDVVHIGSFYLNNRRSSRLCHVVVAKKGVEGASSPDREELIESEWMEVDELNRCLCEMKNGTLLAAWALFQNTRRLEAWISG